MEKEKEDLTKAIKIWIEDDIVMGRWTVKKVDIEIAQEMVEVVSKLLVKLKEGLLLMDMGDCREITPEARKLFNDDKAAKKMAMVNRNLVQRVLTSFALGISTPNYPTKVFSNIEDAKKWLKE